MNKLLFRSMLCAAVLSLGIIGCQTDDEVIDNDASTATDHNYAEKSFEDAGNIGDQAFEKGDLETFRTSDEADILGCATVIVDNNSSPKKITVDFGTGGCLGKDGRTRKGVLEITYNGAYRDSGTVITFTPKNYFVDGYKIEGLRTVKNLGSLQFNVVVSNGLITRPDGKTFTYNCNKTRTWINGSSTPKTFSDDKYGIKGTANGTNVENKTYTAIIQEQLILDLTCGAAQRRHFTKGILDFSPEGKATRTINYGDGTCDNKATVTIEGFTFEILLK